MTVLSRCQRFDLRRIEPEDMIALMRKIAAGEGAEITDDALALITRAAEGSARDATSLLDQAISHGAGETTADQVRAMLGLADRGRVLDLFDMIMRGDAAAALEELGANMPTAPTRWRCCAIWPRSPTGFPWSRSPPMPPTTPPISPDERVRGVQMAEDLPMRALTRMWQMLLKALDEVAAAPNAMMAAEMAVIRLTHVADLPSPEDLVRKLQDTPVPPASAPAPAGGGTPVTGAAPVSGGGQTHATATTGAPSSGGGGGPVAALAPQGDAALARYPSFDHVVDLIRANRDVKLLVEVETTLRLAQYQPGRIEFVPTDAAPADLAQRWASGCNCGPATAGPSPS